MDPGEDRSGTLEEFAKGILQPGIIQELFQQQMYPD